MLIGTYSAVLSDKRRVAVPKKFLEELGNKPIVANWYEGCLILVSSEFWERLFNRLTGGQKALSFGLRNTERFILASAFETEPDDQGRIVIPEVLANYAGLNKEIVFIGLSDRVEIWQKDSWNEKAGDLAKTARDYVEGLDKQK